MKEKLKIKPLLLILMGLSQKRPGKVAGLFTHAVKGKGGKIKAYNPLSTSLILNGLRSKYFSSADGFNSTRSRCISGFPFLS